MTESSSSDKPNIIILVTDDAGYADYSFLGSKISTPNIDKLASKSFIFPNFYNNGRCSPTRASLLTGHYPQKVGVGELSRPATETSLPGYLGYMNLNYPTLPELLNPLGYNNIMAGKWHLGGQNASRAGEQNKWPMQRGFDSFFGIIGGSVRTHFQPGEGDRYMYNNERIPIDVFDESYFSSNGLMDHVVESIEESSQESKNPFFVYLPFFAPHLPLEAPEKPVNKYYQIYTEYLDLLEIKEQRLEGLKEAGLIEKEIAANKELFSSSYEISRSVKLLSLATHAAMMENIDLNIGRLIEALKQSGQYENTLIFLFSDNGVSANGISDIFNSPFYGRKGMLWEGGIKTPLIVTWPELSSTQQIVEQGWHVMDILPTILDFLGESNKSLAGRSFKSALDSGKAPSDLYIDREYLFWSDRKLVAGINKDGMKWIREEGRGNFVYDLKVDPTELNDLAKESPSLIQEFRSSFNTHKRENNVKSFDIVEKHRLIK